MVGFENRIFRKSFSFDRKKDALTTEIHFRSYFHFKWFLERKRERKKRERRSHIRHRRRTPSSSPTITRTRSHRSRRSQHRADRTTPLDLASSNLTIACTRSHRSRRLQHRAAQSHLRAISPSTYRSSTHRSLSLYDFDFCCCCGSVVVVFWWLWLLIAEVCCHGLNCRVKNL